MRTTTAQITRPSTHGLDLVSIDASTADLLRQFAEAKPITEAIIAFSRLNGSNPEETLVETLPCSPAARQRRPPRPRQLECEQGDRAHLLGRRPHRRLRRRRRRASPRDSEVYRGEAADGQLVAVQVARPEAAGLRQPHSHARRRSCRTLDGSGAAADERRPGSTTAPTSRSSGWKGATFRQPAWAFQARGETARISSSRADCSTRMPRSMPKACSTATSIR